MALALEGGSASIEGSEGTLLTKRARQIPADFPI
jgi:hypothetical protein